MHIELAPSAPRCLCGSTMHSSLPAPSTATARDAGANAQTALPKRCTWCTTVRVVHSGVAVRWSNGIMMIMVAVLLATGCASSTPAVRPAPATAASAFVTAMENADADQLAALFDEDATVFMPFDAMPQRLEGRHQIRTAFETFFEPMRKRAAAPPYMKLNPRDLQTQSLGDTAILTFHLGALPAAGATSPAAFSRRTFVVQWKNGRWLIQHLHASNMRLEPPKP